MMFNSVLKSLRTQANLTQKELSQKLGLSESAIGMYERGNREPSFEILEAIADFFNVDMDYLTGRSQVPRRHDITPPSPPSEEDELIEYLEELRTRPEMRILFKTTKSATKEDIEQAVKIIEALRR